MKKLAYIFLTIYSLVGVLVILYGSNPEL